ncbi:signal peptidase I [Macrococcus lamae]|uniref:Signal peptidase I n=1 Tax=Macrococcus lamae TaxID=198484 RepID=A0A4V3BF55_9STAP|nr:signal peptidase I [Macrococcus lamae]TDM12761.1 signal peptidase I [Macrococcus lamae]
MKKELREWFVAIIVAMILIIVIRQFLGISYNVKGESMDPTFRNDDRVVVSKISKELGHIKRGDVIVLHHDKKHDYIKRVIGQAGDKISYKNDILYINDQPVEENYLEENKKSKMFENLTPDFNIETLESTKAKAVPEGKIFVLGDNRLNSFDSEEFGFVNEEQIVGKVVLRYYPFREIKTNFEADQLSNIEK